jgi:D-serine deaminase-like pyridoxal phosphate-dependent protein
MKHIKHPTPLINQSICQANIRRMAEKAHLNSAALRPHFKTHQSAAVGDWYRQAGISGITVSSARMAKAFAEAGWKNITIAFPANILEAELLNELAAAIELRLFINSPETARALKEQLQHPVKFYIEIDTGQRRSGLHPEAYATIDAILAEARLEARQSELLHFHGFYTHPGHSYATQTLAQVTALYEDVLSYLLPLKERYAPQYPDLKLSAGDTPGSVRVEDLQEFDELTPGNFAFFDMQQLHKGVCSWQDIALAMACPVVDVYPDRNEAIIYGGAVHFSKDFYLQSDGSQSFGQLVWLQDSGWSKPVEGAYLKALSQEHGVLSAPDEIINELRPGQLLGFLPAHSCLTANLSPSLYNISSKNSLQTIAIL